MQHFQVMWLEAQTPLPSAPHQTLPAPGHGSYTAVPQTGLRNPEFEILRLIFTETLKEMGNGDEDHSQVQRGWQASRPLHGVSQAAHASPSWVLKGTGEWCVATAGQSSLFCCLFSCPFLIKENLKPLPPQGLCPLSLLDAFSLHRSRQCSKVSPKSLGSPKGYLPGCGLTSLSHSQIPGTVLVGSETTPIRRGLHEVTYTCTPET